MEKGLELLLVMQMKRQFMLLDENSGCEFNAFCAFYELKGERGRKGFYSWVMTMKHFQDQDESKLAAEAVQ